MLLLVSFFIFLFYYLNLTSVVLIQEDDVEALQQRDLTTVQVNIEFCSTAAVLVSLRSSTIKAYQSISVKCHECVFID